MALQMGDLIRQMRRKRNLTQQELSEGIISKSVLSRIENGQAEPDIFVLHALFQRLGKSLLPFEIVVSNKEYERLLQNDDSMLMQTTVIAESSYLKDIREVKGLSQERFSSDICARETISKIEHGRNPQLKTVQTLMDHVGEPYRKYYGYVVTLEYEIYEKVELYQQKRTAYPEEARYLFRDIRKRLDESIPVNRQFIESSELMEKRRKNQITMGEELAGLEQCLRYTMPEYQRESFRMPYRQEVVILEEIIKCLKRIKRPEAAMRLAEELEKKNNAKLKLG